MSDSETFSSEYNSLAGVARPTMRTWTKHLFFLFLTFCTATLAGTLYPVGSNQSVIIEIDRLLSSYWSILSLPTWHFFATLNLFWLLLNDVESFKQGLTFSIPFLLIVTAHEFGHYFACRIYGVEATLPYYIPLPLLSPAGTLGAVIKIESPMPSRKAVFDIGVAGPIAGFIALIPIAIIAFLTMERVGPEVLAIEPDLYFSDGLMIKLFVFLFDFDLNFAIPNGFYFATWFGLLITALNLIPSGQLDGGHAVYAVFGKKIHTWTTRSAFVVMLAISLAGLVFYNSPSGFVFTVILGIMLRLGHPEPFDDSPLDSKRKIIALLTLLIFVLSFVPFPIKSSVSIFQ